MAVDVQGLLIQLDATSARLQREMRRAERMVGTSSKKMERDIGRVDQTMERLGRTANTLRTALGFLGVGASLQGLRMFATAAIRAADSLNTTASRVALNVETLQELRSAAAEVNVQTNQLDMGMQRFGRRLAEAAQGGGELKGILEQYKIELRDGNDQIRTSEQVLYDLADAIQRAGTDGERLRIAFKAFDSEGVGLVNLLRNGSKGLEEARKRSRELGHVIRGDLIPHVSTFNTNLNNLFTTIRTRMQEGFLDALLTDMDDLSEIAKDQAFHRGLEGIGAGIGMIGGAVAGMIGDFGRLIELVKDPSFQNLLALGEGLITRDPLAGAVIGAVGDARSEARMERLLELPSLIADAQRELQEIEAADYLPFQESHVSRARGHLQSLQEEYERLKASFDPANDNDAVMLPAIRVDGDPPGGPPGTPGGGSAGTTIDVGAQAALAAMQRAAQVRDQHANAVGEMLTGLRQEADMNEVTLQHLHDQSGELEVQQRLLEIRQQLGAEAAAEAEPVLRHIQQQTNAIERQTNAYEFLNASAERAFDRIGGAMTRMFMEGEDAAVTWANTVNAIMSEIMQTMMQLAVINPLKNALFGGNAATTADIGGILGSLFHSGGIVGQPTATRMVNPLVFAGAPRMHSGGIAGDEVPAILKRGEEVLPENHPRHRNNASGDVNVSIPVKVVNNAPVQVRTRQAQAPGGGKQLEILIDEMNARNIGSPGTASNKAVRNSFGAQPMLTNRG